MGGTRVKAFHSTSTVTRVPGKCPQVARRISWPKAVLGFVSLGNCPFLTSAVKRVLRKSKPGFPRNKTRTPSPTRSHIKGWQVIRTCGCFEAKIFSCRTLELYSFCRRLNFTGTRSYYQYSYMRFICQKSTDYFRQRFTTSHVTARHGFVLNVM